MNEVDPGRCVGGAIGSERKRTAVLGAVDWLHLVAAPTFALMALLTAVLDGDAHPITCMGVASASPLGSMGLTYLLMSAFHTAPWVKLASLKWNHAGMDRALVCNQQ